MAATAPMALNTPKRLKTTASSCSNYLSTPPPSVCMGSPPPIGTPTDAQTTNGGGHQQGLTAAVTAQQQQHWNWLSEATSPSSSCGSPDAQLNRSFSGNHSSGTPKTWSSSGGGCGSAEKSENKRGRPRSEALTSLMVEGSISPSAIKCRYCNRVFPREKSLQAHLRTHTGERPYQCDYPGCTRAFTQSGQLKTHQRLHTGERPFICSAAQCQMRFTHANRHCPDHPYDTLRRCDDFVIQTVPEQNFDVLRWLEKYRAEREDRTPTRKTPKRGGSAPNGVFDDGGGGAEADGGGEGPDGDTAGTVCAQNGNENLRSEPTTTQRTNDENNPAGNGLNAVGSGGGSEVGGGVGAGHLLHSPITPNNTYKSSRKGLMCELDMNAGLRFGSPLTAKTKLSRPKLIQWQESTRPEGGDGDDESGDEACLVSPAKSTFNPKKKWLRDAWQDDLAKPLEPNVISQKLFSSTTSTMALKQQLHQQQEHTSSGSSSTYSSSPSKRLALAPSGYNSKPLPRGDIFHVGNGHGVATMPVPVAAIDPNQMRPTVLMVASKDCARPLSSQPAATGLLLTNGQHRQCASPKPEENNRKLQGALALMQLAVKDARLVGCSFGTTEPARNNGPPTVGDSILHPPYEDVSPASSVAPDSAEGSPDGRYQKGPSRVEEGFVAGANGLGSYL